MVHEFVDIVVIAKNLFFWVVVAFTQVLFKFSAVREVSRRCRCRVTGGEGAWNQ